LLATVGAAAMLVSATMSGIEALKLSPQQELASWLGQTRAMLAAYDIPSSPPGIPLEQPGWVGEIRSGAQLISVWDGQVSVSDQTGAFVGVAYRELDMPSAALVGNTELIDGRWPARPAECVAAGEVADNAHPPIGEWSLSITGHVVLTYFPGESALICAPGTWVAWRMSADERSAAGVGLMPSWYFAGDRAAVMATLNVLPARSDFPPVTTQVEDDFGRPDRINSQKFLGERLPFVVVPFALALVLAGLLGRWGGEVARALSRSGVPERPMRKAMLTTAWLWSAVAGLIGGLAGSLVGLALRPALSALNGGVPLSPWLIRWPDAALLAGMSGLGAAIGFLGSAVVSGKQLRQRDQIPTPLNPRLLLILAVASVAMIGIAGWVALASAGRLSWMVAATVIMSAAMSALAIPVLAETGRRVYKRPISGMTLGGRILVENQARWGKLTAVVTCLVGLVVSLFMLASSSVAGQLALTASKVPAGSALIETLDPEGNKLPNDVLARFETDLGISNPVALTELDAVVEDWGVISAFESLADAKAVLGDLGSAEDTLRQGGLVVIGTGVGRSEASVDVGGDLASMRIETIKPAPASRFDTGAGFAVRSALHEPIKSADVLRTWNLYRGLNADQDAAVRAWATDSGMGAFQVLGFRPPAGFMFPAWIVVSLAGFGLLMTPLLASALGKEARILRPLAANLSSIGVPAKWIRQSLKTLAVAVLAPALTLAIVGAVGVTAELSVLYPSAFDVVGVPWWMLAVFACCLIAAGYLGVSSAARRLYHRETQVTV
jgi:hypothetical protein